ncbi:MAG TPA: prepilin-type N-terminal cleavage/methylation domain-containing protein [Solirubrobacteraceae bacterium]|nr:prepilin-type N-terminal cleavage/methylation domain-containing protein [Solirubrobacteraceae bacterium]
MPLRTVIRDERGFTLVELLVAMVAGVVVVFALVALIAISLHQETRIADRVQDDRAGRSALNQILEELHSSCTGFGSIAIQAPSTTPSSPLAATGATNVWFLSAYGNSTSGNASVSAVVEHDINWTSSGKTSNTGEPLGTLRDYSFAGSGESPNWSFGTLSTANAKASTLASNVVPAGATTIFHYWRYDTTASDTSTYGKLIEVPASEASTYAANRKIAEVTISYTQAPEDGDTRSGHTATFNGSAVLRLTPPESAAEGTTCA